VAKLLIKTILSMKVLTKLFGILLLNSLFLTLLTAQNPEIKPQDQPRSVSFGGLRARSIGPALMSGRVADVAGVDNNPSIFYVGAANGGVWKSTSGGVSFRPVFEEYQQAIGKIAVDQAHPDTVWVGTGESWVRNSVGVGTGMYVTKNGGSTWEFKGLPNSERIAGIQIDPTNSNILYVAVQGALWSDSPDRGVYKTVDFGKTWEKILYVDEKTGAADLSMDAKNPSVLYATMWEHRRRPDFFSSGGKGSGLFKTMDGGKTWKKIEGNGLPAGSLGRIAVAVAPSNSNTLYISVECEKNTEKGIYKSTDAGVTWKKTNSDFNATVRPFYFSRLTVDPTNENKLIKAGYNGIISEDGGNTFRLIYSGVHADMHCFYINPKNPKTMILGCDGGAYMSYDGGYLWNHCKDLPLSQFYHISVDDDEPYNVYGGLQDNGSWYAPNEQGGGVKSHDWNMSSYGDGFYVFRHPVNKDVVFSESQGGDLVRHNKKDGTQKDIKPMPKVGEPEYRWNWNAPISISPNNPNRMYFGSQFLFRTDNMGDTWAKISPDLTTNDPKRQDKKTGGLSPDWSGAETNTTIVQIAESPKDANLIWCGTDDGNVQVTIDGGKTWANVTANIPAPKGLWISHVEPSKFDKNTCFVTIDGHRSGDKKPYVFKTTDLGKTWIAFPTEGVEAYAHCIVEDILNKELLFLGTEFGLYISIDGGKSWKRFTNNVPKTAIMKMVIHPKEGDLIMATHGRGILIIDDLKALRELTKEIQDKDFHVFETKPRIYKYRNGSSGYDGAGNFYGENSPSELQIVYYQKKRHTFGDMKIEIYDPSGKLMKDIPAGKAAGINVVEMPTAYPPPKQAPTTNLEAMGRGGFPPVLPEGKYSFKIVKGKEVYPGSFDIKFPDNSPWPAADRKIQQQLALQVYDLVNKLGWQFYQMQGMQKQAQKLATEFDATDKKFAKQLTDFGMDIEKYLATITTTDGDFYVASGEHLREEMSRTYSAIVGYPGKPADTQIDRLKYFEGEVVKVQTKLDSYIAQMTKLNETIAKAGKTAITIKTLKEYLEK
jgi:photosystem II stability/assembly factor-like uncharacterized protein